jgi:hypothetical protein
MNRRLDRVWWTSIGFFVASVAISAGGILYGAHVDEQRYAELYQMMVTIHVPKLPTPTPAPAWTEPLGSI